MLRYAPLVIAFVVVGSPDAFGGDRRSGRVWITAHAGVTFGTSVTLEQEGVTSEDLSSADGVDPLFGISAYYRTAFLDFGVLVDSVGGGLFADDDADRPIGGKLRVAALVRWRYLNERWGALVLGLRPGWVGFNHSDYLRNRVALQLGREPGQLDGIDTFNSGFTFGAHVGVVFYLSDSASVFVEAEAMTAVTGLQSNDAAVDLDTAQPLFTIGVELGL